MKNKFSHLTSKKMNNDCRDHRHDSETARRRDDGASAHRCRRCACLSLINLLHQSLALGLSFQHHRWNVTQHTHTHTYAQIKHKQKNTKHLTIQTCLLAFDFFPVIRFVISPTASMTCSSMTTFSRRRRRRWWWWRRWTRTRTWATLFQTLSLFFFFEKNLSCNYYH